MFVDPIDVRGCKVEPGDLVFIYRPETADLRYGNIEDVTDTGFIVSFEQPTWDRRLPAIALPFADVILAPELSARDTLADGKFYANDIVLKTSASDSAEPLALVATQEDSSYPMLVVPVAWDAQHGWSQSGAPFIAKPSDLFHPTTLSLIQRFRFLQPVHPMFDVLFDPIGQLLDMHQPALLKLRGVDVPLDVQLSIKGHTIEIKANTQYAIAGLLGGVEGKYLTNERLVPLDKSMSDWNAHVAVGGVSLNFNADAGYSATVQLLPGPTTIVHSNDKLVATRESYIGAPVESWSDVACRREPPLNPMLLRLRQNPPNAIFFRCFERDAIMYMPRNHTDVEDDYLPIVYPGAPIADDDHAVLSAFIGYITGGRARSVLTETFSLAGKVKTTIHDRGTPTDRRQPPVPIATFGPYSRMTTNNFSRLIEEFRRWRAVDQRSFDAVFHHYAEGADSSFPVTRVLRFTIAYEAFINLVTQDKAEDETIVDTSVYDSMEKYLHDVLEFYAKDHRSDISVEAEKRFYTKLRSFNTGSNSRRIKQFQRLVPIALTTKEKKLIRRLRNDSVHKGFLGDGEKEQDVLGDAKDADLLTDIINRSILYYAGYDGPVLSSHDGRWMYAQSGKTYHVPVVPQGENIEIHNQATPRPLTVAEQDAIVALQGMQRKPSTFVRYIEDATIPYPIESL